MRATRVIACLLLKGQGLVKTVRFRNPVYVGDPVNAIRIFNEKEVDELVVLDISASREGRGPSIDIVRDMASECFMPLGYGGGIRNVADVKALLATGVEKVILNTIALDNLEVVAESARECGNQSVVVSIDVRRKLLGGYEVYRASGARSAGLDPVGYARQLEAAGAGEILLTSVERDGTQTGYDIDLIRRVSDAVSVPVIASGGAGSLEHFSAAVRDGHASAVAAGSMFVFHGRHRAVLISYPSQKELGAALA